MPTASTPATCRPFRWAGVRTSDFYFFSQTEPGQALPEIIRLVKDAIPNQFGFDPVEDIQVLTPMQRGDLGARNLNRMVQQAPIPGSPPAPGHIHYHRKGHILDHAQGGTCPLGLFSGPDPAHPHGPGGLPWL